MAGQASLRGLPKVGCEHGHARNGSATVATSAAFASGRFRLLHLHAAALGEHHLVEQLHQRVDGFDCRRRRVGELGHLQDRADQRLGLKRAAGLEVLWAPTDSAPAMRFSIETRKVTPSFWAISCASFIIVAASSRVSANWQMSTSVAWVSAEIGLNERLPHAFSHISERISGSTIDFSPALMKTSCNSLTRSVSLPSSSPIGKRSPSTWWITPGAVAAAAG